MHFKWFCILTVIYSYFTTVSKADVDSVLDYQPQQIHIAFGGELLY